MHLTYDSLLIPQGLWQAHCEILLIFLKEFVKLNVNTDTIIKNSEICGIKNKYCNYFLQYIYFKDDFIKCKCLFRSKNYQQKFTEKLNETIFNTCKKKFKPL